MNSHYLSWHEDYKDCKPRYQKIACVGKGTYGRVYKAVLVGDPNRFFALKKIQMFREKDGFPINSLREIKILQNLDHRNIVKLYSIMTSKKSKANKNRRSTFLVFEYMEHDFVSLLPNVTFKMKEIKCLMKQLLEGTSYIHSKNVIHRDLKSGNLLLNNKGEIKICDFGLARYHYIPNVKLTLGVATLWYRAPELLFGDPKYNNKIDIWSLGCIFAEMLTKRVLFESKLQTVKDQMETIYDKMGHPDENWPEVRNLKFYNELKPKKKYKERLSSYLKELNPEINYNCVDLLERMLSYNPKTRISASSALSHPFFADYPLPCFTEQVTVFEKEYHHLLEKTLKYKKRNKFLQERKLKNKLEMEERSKHPYSQYDINKTVIKKQKSNRLQQLLGKRKHSDQHSERGDGNKKRKKSEH